MLKNIIPFFIMIICKICNKQFKSILSGTHLKLHNENKQSYKLLYPNEKTETDEYLTKKSIAIKKSIKSHHEKIGHIKKITIRKTKEEISEVRKHQGFLRAEKFKSGELKHWNIGNKTSKETKEKIRNTLNETNIPKVKITRDRKKIEKELKLQTKQLELKETQRELNEFLNLKNIKLISDNKIDLTLSCLKCSCAWNITSQYLDKCRRDKLECRACFPKETTSLAELEIFNFIKQYDDSVISCDRTVLSGKELDILLPNKKIAFEYNGNYWHSESNSVLNKHHISWKQKYAYTLGYQVYNIFEDEWINKQEIVKSRILSIIGQLPNRIYSRKLKIVELLNVEKNDFLNENHLQGSDISSIRYGLKDNNGVIYACMTFKKSSYVKGGDGSCIELNRFAVKKNYSVPGAANRLLKYFMKHNKFTKIISYADKRWSNGNLYKTLGFKFIEISPPSYWYMKNYKDRLHRSNFMKHKLVEEGYDQSLTEWEIMKIKGYDRIWDCGTLKYELN